MRSFKLPSGLCLAILGLAVASPVCLARAGAVPAIAPVVTAPVGGPAAPITALYARLTEMERSHGSFAQRVQLLTPTVDRVFNLQTVLQNSLGLRYRTLPDAQKQQLLEQFRQFTVARYVSNFAVGGSEQFKVEPAATPSPVPGDQIVHTQIVSGGTSTPINYVMRQGAGEGWQVVDVLLNGNISQVAVQRADFGSSLTSGDATPLIESLRKKTQAFSDS